MSQTTLETKITDVTVFRDGARVTRRGQAMLASGENVLIVGGITQHAHEDSFRVRGTGNASLKSIDVKRVSKTFEPEGELQRLREELEQLTRRRDRINDSIQYQQKRKDRLSDVLSTFSSNFGEWYAIGQAKAESLTVIDNTIMEMLKDCMKTLRALSEELREVELAIRATENNIQRIQGQRRIDTLTEVRVTLNTTQSTKIELELEYQVAKAGWSSTYDVDTSETEARVKRIALVTNNSLEDWIDVALTVSTASARPVEAVKGEPFYIDVRERVRSHVPYGPDVKAEDVAGIPRPAPSMLAQQYEKSAEPYEMAKAAETYAEASETLGGTTVYTVPGRLTIVSEREPQPVTLTEESFSCSRLHYWNAYAMPEVVVQDEISNGDSVLLPGKVMTYAEGDFVGESRIGLIAPREKFRIGTRTVYDVKAEKRLVLKDTEKAGISRGKKRRAYVYRLEIKNFSKRTVTIRIVDRIPNSVSEKIVVTLESTSLPPKSVEMGIIEWLTTVEPDKELQIEYRYSVEWDSAVQIVPELP